MSGISTTTRSLRSVRLQAHLPRVCAMAVLVILAAAGLRSALKGPPQPLVTRIVSASSLDQGQEAFAESFTRVYLSWDGADATAREAALKPFLTSGLDEDVGVQPKGQHRQTVSWTSVVGEHPDGKRTLVTVAAQTTNGLVYLSVPVARDTSGFLYVAGYPAVVGPPATDPSASLPLEQPVNDGALEAVVTRAVTNYLARNRTNLLADLTPDALVSLPAQPLTVTDTQQITWAIPGSRVAVVVLASDAGGDTLTLRYELTVTRLDRWYVRSIEVNPTFQGGT
jgi:Conjugative transposon protein TcpC